MPAGGFVRLYLLADLLQKNSTVASVNDSAEALEGRLTQKRRGARCIVDQLERQMTLNAAESRGGVY